jgi:hypothetical protein
MRRGRSEDDFPKVVGEGISCSIDHREIEVRSRAKIGKGRGNRSGGIFGFLSKEEKEHPQPYGYHRHHSHASTNKKKGT